MQHSFIFVYYLLTILPFAKHCKSKVVMEKEKRDIKNTKLNSSYNLASCLGLRSLVTKKREGCKNVRTS